MKNLSKIKKENLQPPLTLATQMIYQIKLKY